MGSNTGFESSPSVDQRDFWDHPRPSGSSARGLTDQLTRRAALTVVLALSLGLWAAIWAAVASLASAVFG
jgi:hypothetical protein